MKVKLALATFGFSSRVSKVINKEQMKFNVLTTDD